MISIEFFSPYTTFAVMWPAHPPERWDLSFLDWAAELKRRFQSHSSQLYDTSLQSWVGGRSFKMHAHNRLCSKMAKDTKICTRVKDDPPSLRSTQACDPHTATLCSSPQPLQWCDPAHPPERWDLSFLDRAAELKRRFQSHLITQQSTKQLEWDGSLKNTKLLPQLGAPRTLTVTTLRRFKLQRKTRRHNLALNPTRLSRWWRVLLLKLLNWSAFDRTPQLSSQSGDEQEKLEESNGIEISKLCSFAPNNPGRTQRPLATPTKPRND